MFLVKRNIAAAMLALLCVLACADPSAPADTTAPLPSTLAAQPNPFPQGLWTLETYGSYASQPWMREQLYTGTLGLSYYFWPNWSIGMECKGLDGLQPEQDVVSFGGDFILRTHLIVEQNWSFFTDVAPGLLESSHRIPPSGTDFNFTIETGFGITAHLWDRTELLTGVRYLHLSNARQEGSDRNPSLNAFEGYVGLLIKL
jgi:hypothetical protein